MLIHRHEIGIKLKGGLGQLAVGGIARIRYKVIFPVWSSGPDEDHYRRLQ